MLTDLRVPPAMLVDCRAVYENTAAGVRVGEDQYLWHDGRLTTAVWVAEPATTRVVALTGEGKLVVRWRWTHHAGPVWELPGVDLPPGAGPTDPAASARRGLAETGWTAEEWTHLAEIGNVTAVADRTVHLYLATGLRAHRARVAVDTAEPGLLAWPDAVAVAAGAGLRDATSIAAVLIAHNQPGLTDWATQPHPDTTPGSDRHGSTGIPAPRRHPHLPPRAYQPDG